MMNGMKQTILLLAVLVLVTSTVTGVFAEESGKGQGEQKVAFNFVDVDIATITKFISDVTGKNFIFDERVKGKVTVIAPTKLSIDDSFNLFTSILELKGFSIVPSGVNAYKIVASTEARQKGINIATSGQSANESFVARLMTLDNIAAEDATKLALPLVSRNGNVSAFGPGNMILIVDAGLNVDKIVSLIEAADKPSVKEDPELVFLKHSSAEAVVKTLNEGVELTKTVQAQARGANIPGSGKAVADSRLNAVILFGDKRVKDSMKTLISLLDVPAEAAFGKINVFFLEHADASELVEVLRELIRGSAAHPTSSTERGSVPVTPFRSAESINISADKSTNALIITASQSDYENLVQIISKLDRKRRQVYVEAMIVEASIDKLRDLGTKWRAVGTHNGDPVAIGGFGTIDSSAITSIITGLTGFSAGGMGNYLDVPITTFDPSSGEAINSTLTVPGFAVLFSLNEFNGAVNVLSTPQLLTSDNKEAEIVVGENVPLISARERDVTTTNTVINSIERQDVGIKLKLTPQITEGDYIKLELYQEISSVKQESTTVVITVGPSLTKRSTQTTVVVKDSQTVVIGGLMEEKDDETVEKMPVLGDIPLLGWLFKTKSVSKRKTNLLVFITPHIIKEPADLDALTEVKQKTFSREEKRYMAGELLVKFKDGVPDEKAREILAAKGAEIISVMESLRIYHVRLRDGEDIEKALKEYKAIPEVEYVEPNYLMKLQEGRK